MAERNVSNFHVEYMDVMQHWSDTSEKFAGADSLITMLYEGWEMNKEIRYEEHVFAEMRSVTIYYVDLERNGEKMTMPVIHNPYISRLISNNEVTVVPVKKSSK